MSSPVPIAEAPFSGLFQFYDVEDFPRTGRATVEFVDFATQVLVPMVKGDKGDTGNTGPGINLVGTIANQAARPTGLTSADAGKGWWRLDNYTIDTWNGSAWNPGINLRGPQGPAANISSASDYDSTVVATTGATLRFSGNGKYFAQQQRLQGFERTSNQTGLTANASTALVWQQSAFGSGYTWSASTNPSRIGIAQAGIYRVESTCFFQNAGGDTRQLDIRRNGTDTYAGSSFQSVQRTTAQVSAVIPCTAGDYIEVLALHNSGGDLSAQSANHGVRVSLEYLGPVA